MNEKRTYEIIEDIDCCLLHTAELRELCELFRSGFEMQNMNVGVIALDVIIKDLQTLERDINMLHTKMDLYGLLGDVSIGEENR